MINYPETHKQGLLSIENLEIIQKKDLTDVDVGLQISTDGRIWLCIDGIAFIRFKPYKNQEKLKC